MKGFYITPDRFVNFSELKSASLASEIATRANSSEYWGTVWGALPDPDLVLKKLGLDVRVYHETMTDPHVFSCMEQRKAKTLSMNWEINRGGAKSRNIKLIESVFNDPDFRLHAVMEAMLNCVAYGMQPMEIMWEQIGQYWLPVSVEEKPVEWFIYDDENRPRFKSQDDPIDGMLLPYRKFLIARNKPTYANPYGEKVLSRCYWPALFKKSTEKWWIEFLEKYGSLFAVGKLPRSSMGEGSKEQSSLLEMLSLLIQSGTAVIPDDGSVDFKESATKQATSDIYKTRCDYSNNEISKAILTQTLTTEIGNKGSYAASETHSDMLTHLSLKDRSIIESELNLLIKWIYEVNFSDTNIPKFEMFLPEDVDKDLADRDKILTECGVKFTRGYFIKAYNFKEEDLKEVIPDSPQPDNTNTSNQDNASNNINNPEDLDRTTTGNNDFAEEKTSTGLIAKLKNAWDNIFESISKKKSLNDSEINTALTDSLSRDAYDKIAEGILLPVINAYTAVVKKTSLQAVRKDIPGFYDKMNADELITLLDKMFFTACLYQVKLDSDDYNFAEASMYELSNIFRLPPKDALQYFRDKGYTFSFNYKDVLREAHTRSFTVAKVMKLDILQDLRAITDKFISEGITVDEAIKQIQPVLANKGWWGKVPAKDVPGVDVSKLDDPNKLVQLGSYNRIKTILSTNETVAHRAAHYRQLMDITNLAPYWQYIQLDRPSKRKEHEPFHEKVFRFDDKIWDIIFPPNGWHCMCHIKALTEKQFNRLNIPLSTGDEVTYMPPEEWAYNPGKTNFEVDKSKYDNDILSAAK